MKIVIFGLSITSAWGNGHATTYRALLRGLHQRGHKVVFFEQDQYWYADNRDLPEPDFCELKLYSEWATGRASALRELRDADAVMVGSFVPSGAQILDDVLASAVPVKCFYDIDTPITFAHLREGNDLDYLRRDQVAALDVYFSFTGGPMLAEIEEDFHVPKAVPLYCSVEADIYHPHPSQRYSCELSYMGTYAPDRQAKLDELLIATAARMPDRKFIVAGAQYPKSVRWPGNVRRITHLNPRWHPHLYSSSRFTLNLTRREMVMAGHSPSVRLFEAAACGATIISDRWSGLDSFFMPGAEILLATSTEEVTFYLTQLGDSEITNIGAAARARVSNAHTSAIRAVEFERAIEAAAHSQLPPQETRLVEPASV